MKKYNLNFKILIFFIIIIITLTSTIYIIDTKINRDITEISKKQSGEYLQAISELRKGHIETYLEMLKLRMLDFSSDGKIKQCLYDIKYNISSGCDQKELSEHLIINKLPIFENINELIILDINGIIVSSTNPKYIGINRKNDTYFSIGKDKIFIKDLYYSEVTKEKQIVISAPITHNNEFVGVIASRRKPEEFYKIIQNIIEIPGNIYIVNTRGELINPSKHLSGENKGILTQIMNTKNYIECKHDLKEKNNNITKFGEHHTYKTYEFIDYRGENVIGTHKLILEMQWCILSEIEISLIEKNIHKYEIIQYITSLIELIIFTIIGYIVGINLKEKRKY